MRLVLAIGLCGFAGLVAAQSSLDSQREEYKQAWLGKSDLHGKTFLDCVTNYAKSHMRSKLTATELSGAAVGACRSDLANFRNDQEALVSLIYPNASAMDVQSQADSNAAKLTETAKGLVLQMAAEQK